jgi:hypothetical protein
MLEVAPLPGALAAVKGTFLVKSQAICSQYNFLSMGQSISFFPQKKKKPESKL